MSQQSVKAMADVHSISSLKLSKQLSMPFVFAAFLDSSIKLGSKRSNRNRLPLRLVDELNMLIFKTLGILEPFETRCHISSMRSTRFIQ